MSQPRENLWTDGRMDRETLFYRTLLAKIGGPKIEKETKKGVIANQKQKKKQSYRISSNENWASKISTMPFHTRIKTSTTL